MGTAAGAQTRLPARLSKAMELFLPGTVSRNLSADGEAVYSPQELGPCGLLTHHFHLSVHRLSATLQHHPFGRLNLILWLKSKEG